MAHFFGRIADRVVKALDDFGGAILDKLDPEEAAPAPVAAAAPAPAPVPVGPVAQELLEIRFAELEFYLKESAQDLATIQSRLAGGALPAGQLFSQKEMQEVIERRTILHDALIAFKAIQPKEVYSAREQEIREVVKAANEVFNQLTTEIAKIEIAQYTKDLEKYENDPSYKNAIALQRSAIPLLKTLALANDRGMGLGVDTKVVKQHRDVAKTIRDDIEIELIGMSIPADMSDDVLNVLGSRISQLYTQIDEIVEFHNREIYDAKGQPLSVGWEELVQWKAACEEAGEELIQELGEIREKSSDGAKKSALSSIIDTLRRMLISLRNLLQGGRRREVSPASENLTLNMEAAKLTAFIANAATDLSDLQYQVKALETARSLPFQDAVAHLARSKCGPVSQEVIDKRDALQEALTKFNNNRESVPGYQATKQELLLEKAAQEVLEQLTSIITHMGNEGEFGAFNGVVGYIDALDAKKVQEQVQAIGNAIAAKNRGEAFVRPELPDRLTIPQLWQAFHEENTRFLEAQRYYQNNGQKPIDAKKAWEFAFKAVRLGVMIRELREEGYYQFRNQEVIEQDDAYISELIRCVKEGPDSVVDMVPTNWGALPGSNEPKGPLGFVVDKFNQFIDGVFNLFRREEKKDEPDAIEMVNMLGAAGPAAPDEAGEADEADEVVDARPVERREEEDDDGFVRIDLSRTIN